MYKHRFRLKPRSRLRISYVCPRVSKSLGGPKISMMISCHLTFVAKSSAMRTVDGILWWISSVRAWALYSSPWHHSSFYLSQCPRHSLWSKDKSRSSQTLQMASSSSSRSYRGNSLESNKYNKMMSCNISSKLNRWDLTTFHQFLMTVQISLKTQACSRPSIWILSYTIIRMDNA